MADVDAYNLAVLIIRVWLAVVMLAHGINHIFGGGKIAGTGRWFESLGMKPGPLHAWTASLTELGAGALLILGLLTPLAAAGVVGVMVVAFITNHRKVGFFVFKRPTEGYEYVLTLTFVALALGALGAGEWSVDDALDMEDMAGWTGFWITVIAGFGGAAGLLAVFWRPPPPDTEGD